MQLSQHDARRFRALAYYVRVNLPEILRVPVIVSAMNRIGQINLARLSRALRWGQGPTISVVKNLRDSDGNPVFGLFRPNIGSQLIEIDEDMVDEFQAGRGVRITARGGRVFLVGVTILHELIHWGDDQDGIDRDGEEGEEFETAVYGAVVN